MRRKLRTHLYLALSCLVCWLSPGWQVAFSRTPDSSFFPVAVWYGGGKVRAPMLERIDASSAERWGRDLDQIKSVGFNTIKCWVDWATAEPEPGRWDFQNLDLLLRLAQERGLRVIVQVYLDSAPDWVGARYPDGRFVDRSGAVIQSQAAPGYCMDHDGVRAEMVRFLAALAREANRSAALYGWDVWSEPHVINWADFPYLPQAEFCYCASSQNRFRAWLRAKYRTIEALNAAWYRGFARWDEVEAPRFPTILSYTDYLDWRAFIDDKLAGDLNTRVKAIRTADRVHPVTSHAAVPGLFTSPADGYGEPDDWKMSSAADYFGTSLYPKHSESAVPWSYRKLAAALDFTRSAGRAFGKGFWIGELQAGQGATGMRIVDPVSPREEVLWMWQAVAGGAREIAIYAWYPMSSGYESNGYGLINLDGTLTERAVAAGRVAQVIDRRAAEINASQPAPAAVAILYNRLAYMVGGSQPSLSQLGNAARDSLTGLHRAFFERHIPVDFVDDGEVAAGRLGAYRILFLPYPVMLSREVANGVRSYVESGGTAVAEARLAWNDARGFASDVIPGGGLSRVFGGREKVIRPVERAPMRVERGAGLAGLPSGSLIQSGAFEEDLEPLGASRVLARFANGQPAIIENPYGRGRAILIGSFPGLDYERRHDASTARLFLALARQAGVTPPVEVSGEGAERIEVRRLISQRDEIAFVFNHAYATSHARIALSVPWGKVRAEDFITGRSIEIAREDDKLIFKPTLAGNEVGVFRIYPE